MLALVLSDPVAYVRRGGAEGLAAVAPENPIWVKFARAMVPFAAPIAAATADRVAARRLAPRRVLDLAAGHGLFGLGVPALDWAPVLAVARANAGAAGLPACWRWIEGSAFETE